MPRGNKLDRSKLSQRLRSIMSESRPLDGATLCRLLGVGQSSFSRLAASQSEWLLAFGRTKSRKYVGARFPDQVELPISVFQIDEKGRIRDLGDLFPAARDDFIFVSKEQTNEKEIYFQGAPHFLSDLQPRGFLARHIPARYPELRLPPDPSFWSTDLALKYVTRHVHDAIGDLVIGRQSMDAWLKDISHSALLAPKESRKDFYARCAENILSSLGGSSAGGEQPKFLARVSTQERPDASAEEGFEVSDVIVKFSPALSSPVGRRVADLLVCEHIALTLLRQAGWEACATEIIVGDDRVFLEVLRFDRVPLPGRRYRGRRGTVSLAALDMHHLARLGSWTETTTALEKRGLVPKGMGASAAALDLFGKLIANNDRHNGNLSFFCRWPGEVIGLAPVYDMNSMLYAPRAGEIVDTQFDPAIESILEMSAFPKVSELALQFWSRVSEDSRVSQDFRRIAASNFLVVRRLESITGLQQ